MDRPYRGVAATERLTQRRQKFVDAALDLLGGDTDPADLTVRAVCGRAGLTARYFYENFTDMDALVEAVFDDVTGQLASTTQAAVAAAPPAEQNRAGIGNVVRTVAADPRIGRLLFSTQLSNAALLRMRTQRHELLLALGDQHIRSALRIEGSHRLKATTNFVLGGMGHTISAWLAGDFRLTVDELVDLLVTLFADLDNPRLFHD